MAIQNLKNVDEYAQYLEENFNELKALFYYFLIGVTSFFREPTAFETLQKKVIPLLFINKNSDSAIRIWVPGCSWSHLRK
jgi:two-component system CheB/CheR fusion protein